MAKPYVMSRIEVLRLVMLVALTLVFSAPAHQVQARGGFGGFHGGGFHVARIGGLRSGSFIHPGGMGAGLRMPNGAMPTRMHVTGAHPLTTGGLHAYHPVTGIHPGGYGGIHTGGYLTGARYAPVHYRPSMGYYHPPVAAHGINAARAASLGNVFNYYSTYYHLGGISPSYVADPYYNPYQNLYGNPSSQ